MHILSLLLSGSDGAVLLSETETDKEMQVLACGTVLCTAESAEGISKVCVC